MENEDSVQEATLPESGDGGGGGSSGVSAAEPVAPAAAAEPAPEASVESAPVSAESFPGVDSFDWDGWDGSDYEAFPEQVRPWADRLGYSHKQYLQGLTTKHESELDYWKRMYEAMSYGEEDPRIADLTSQLEKATKDSEELNSHYAHMKTTIEQEREAENDRYFKWFEKNYQGKLETLAKTHGAESAEKLVLDLMELDMDVHVAVEVSLMGTEAAEAAKVLSSQIQDSAIVLELIQSRYKAPDTPVAPTPAPRAERTPNPATQVVAGSAPASRPAQLSKEKSPTYGAGQSERMGALMAAAENAIRKSKRR